MNKLNFSIKSVGQEMCIEKKELFVCKIKSGYEKMEFANGS